MLISFLLYMSPLVLPIIAFTGVHVSSVIMENRRNGFRW